MCVNLNSLFAVLATYFPWRILKALIGRSDPHGFALVGFFSLICNCYYKSKSYALKRLQVLGMQRESCRNKFTVHLGESV